MDQYHKKTCIRFKPRTDERDYISIYPDEGCYSLVGRVGGKQPVSLDAGCIQVIEKLYKTIFYFILSNNFDINFDVKLYF